MKLDETLSKYWTSIFNKMCPQSSIDEWNGIEFYKVAEAAKNGDKSAREYIFWQMRDTIEYTFAKNRKRIKAWSDRLGLIDDSNPNNAGSLNQSADNWISAAWVAIFEGYQVSQKNTIGPFIKYVSKERGLDYLTWTFSKKAPSIAYAETNLEITGGMSIERQRNVGGKKQDLSITSGNTVLGDGGDHSIKRELQDDFNSLFLTPEEEFELKDNLRTFKAFTRDPDLNVKKNGLSPMIAFKTVVLNMSKGDEAEKSVATLADKYGVARNTFATYAERAAKTLVNDYELSYPDLQQLIKAYGPEALGQMIRESKFMPKLSGKLNENYDFHLLESIFGRSSLKESVKLVSDCPCCGYVFEEKDDGTEDYVCPDCGELWEYDDMEWHQAIDGEDEFQDGAPDTHLDDILAHTMESTNLKEHANPYASRAAEICKSLTKQIDFEEDDDAMQKAADILLEYIDAVVEESMQYFPVDAFEPDLWKVWENHEAHHNHKS